jgi:predicted DNA-binding transcriptional regulator AlpA
MSANQLLNITQAAALLRLSPRTLDGFRNTGRGPRFAKLGRRVMYDSADLAAWVEASKRTRTKEKGGAAV